LFFGHPNEAVFTERSERLVVGVAAQAAIAIDNARLYEATKQAAEERARLLEAEREARAEVERVSMQKDEFLATLSHELRTPLNAILGWSELLQASEGREADLHRGLQAIARNARAQAQLIEDLLDMNRIASGNLRLDVQQVDLGSVIVAALEAVRPSIDAKQITLRTLLTVTAPVFGDPNRLQQIVWNLVSNAVKFTPKGGQIDVILQARDSHVEVIVNDSGIGIDPSFLPHIFERFRQADSSSTRKYGGLGLGLSIVKQLVALHGGEIRAESSGEGRGTTFVFTLPVRAIKTVTEAKQDGPSSTGVRREQALISLEGICVLVVDDELDARELVMSVLSHARATVCAAESAESALEMLPLRRPDVIVSDIGMPQCDGYTFMQTVRSLPAEAGGKIPAVALTAFCGPRIAHARCSPASRSMWQSRLNRRSSSPPLKAWHHTAESSCRRRERRRCCAHCVASCCWRHCLFERVFLRWRMLPQLVVHAARPKQHRTERRVPGLRGALRC
jgi:signal transduction histidine kinase/CheY-like chemotaxis protein